MSLAFRGRHFAPDIILLCMGWSCRYALSYRDLEEMMAERGLSVDHTTIDRWVQHYAPSSTDASSGAGIATAAAGTSMKPT